MIMCRDCDAGKHTTSRRQELQSPSPHDLQPQQSKKYASLLTPAVPADSQNDSLMQSSNHSTSNYQNILSLWQFADSRLEREIQARLAVVGSPKGFTARYDNLNAFMNDKQ